MRRSRGPWVTMGVALAGLAGALAPAQVDARTAEVHVVVKVDLQRAQPSGPPDEPLEPAPSLQQRARDVVAAHPGFREVTVRVLTSEAPPNPRVPADFLRLVGSGVDDVVVVNLSYHLRLDNFRATGSAAVRGFVAVHSVAGRRQVVSRLFTVAVGYPGDVTKEAVLQAELGARARGAPVPIEEVELGLLDSAVKGRLERELASALGIYQPRSLPRVSHEAVENAMGRMARFLAESPDRRTEAIQLMEEYVRRYPDAPQRGDLDRRLRQLRQVSARDPAQEAQRQQDRAANRVSQTVSAAQLAELFERLVGSVVEVRSFKLDWRDGTVVMTPADRNQDFVVEQVPNRMRELDADPPAIYVLVVGRRWDPRLPGVDLKLPVVRWVGCPKTACPAGL